jgi:uncharacterized Tic20 family protein
MSDDPAGGTPNVAPPPPSTPLAPPPQPLSDSEARSWAMLAHLSVLLNVFTAFFGVVAALLIYLIYKDRSRYVAYQAMQSFIFQLIWWLGASILSVILWSVGWSLVFIIVGCFILPVAMLVTLAPIAAVIWGIYGGLQCNEGKDFKYWLIGDWVRHLA